MPKARLFFVDIAQQIDEALRCGRLAILILLKAGQESLGTLKACIQPRGNLRQCIEGLACHLFGFDARKAGQIVPLADEVDFMLLRRIAERENVTAHGRIVSGQYFIDQFIVARQRCNVHLGDELRDLGNDKSASCLFAFFIARRCRH
jgi:hypothetical protein